MDFTIVLKDLQKYKRPKSALLPFYIQERLNQSLKTYYKEVKNSLRYYREKDELKILKGLGDEK